MLVLGERGKKGRVISICEECGLSISGAYVYAHIRCLNQCSGIIMIFSSRIFLHKTEQNPTWLPLLPNVFSFPDCTGVFSLLFGCLKKTFFGRSVDCRIPYLSIEPGHFQIHKRAYS